MGKLGYSSLTLTDITETIPISLALQSNLDQGVQIKNGDLYSPDFTEGEGLIITPSLFLGSSKIDVPVKGEKGAIFYQITGETDSDGTEKNFFYSGSSSEEIYVDENGCLHYKKNLNEAITVEAYILNYKNTIHDYTIETISALNPITVLFLEQMDKENYSVIITTTDGREHFDEDNISNITLTAKLFKGTEEITEGLEYEWDIISDTDNGESDDYKETTQSVIVRRQDVSNVEAFQCTITISGTGLSFSTQKIIRDFTDGYTNQLIADGTLILTPKNTSVSLSNQVRHQAKIINDTEDQSRFIYEWKLLKQNMEEVELSSFKNSKKLIIDLNKEPFNALKENFSILGSATIDGKAFTVNYIDITYQPISYSVEVSPKQIFVPTSSKGELQMDSFSADFVFKLLDEDKQPLIYEESGSQFSGGEYCVSSSQTDNKWEFNVKITIEKEDPFFNSADTSKNIAILYQYLGNSFTETIQLIKNYAGADGSAGSNGKPAYNVYLSNDYYLFAGGETAATAGQVAEFTINAYYGADELYVSKVIFGNNDYTLDNMNSTISNQSIGTSGILMSYNATTRIFSLITQGEGDFLTSSGSIKMVISTKENENDDEEQNFLVFFNYSINYNGNSYSLIPSENQIVYLLAQYKFNISYIKVDVYCKEGGTGNNIAFNEGYITYAIDGKNESTPEKGSLITFSTADLNASNSYVKFNLYKDVEKTSLLDTQTVPILTSYEGLEVGGENLLRWTKTFSQGTTKWNGINVSFGTDGDFTTVEYESDVDGNILSPKITMEENYANCTFVLSGLVKTEALPSFYLYGCDNIETTSRTYYSMIDMKYEKEGTWKRVYQVFEFSSFTNWKSDTNANIASIDFSSCPYFGIGISGNVASSIKQLKLELGNIPTAWSASPYDITYDEVVGANLLETQGLSFEVKTTDPYKIACGTLEKNKTYTLSFSSASNNIPEINEVNEFLCQIVYYDEENSQDVAVKDKLLLNNNQMLQSWTFTTGEKDEYSLRIYAYDTDKKQENEYTLTLTKVKLELGNEPTSFFVDDEYFDNLINRLQQQTNNTSNELISYKDENGKTISALAEDIKAINGKSYITADEAKGLISVETNNFYQNDEYLQQLKGSIELSTTNADNPYIKIATKATDTNIYTKITKDELGFYDGDDVNAVAKITNQAITISSAYFTDNFHIGDLLVTVDNSGVGFTWDNSK